MSQKSKRIIFHTPASYSQKGSLLRESWWLWNKNSTSGDLGLRFKWLHTARNNFVFVEVEVESTGFGDLDIKSWPFWWLSSVDFELAQGDSSSLIL